MRYIGNKTKLLPFLKSAIARLGIAPGIAHDAFAGTAAVGRALKSAGWVVHSSDLMTYSYVMQRAYVVASTTDSFDELAKVEPGIPGLFAERGLAASVRSIVGADRGNGLGANEIAAKRLSAVADYLATGTVPIDGFFAKNFSAAGGRMYFTDENARRIDAARTTLYDWRHRGLLADDTFYILLAAVIEGADRVANTAGVYAAFIKQWQPNALRPLTIVAEPPIRTRARCIAHQADAAAVAETLGSIDLLYVDPPYNTRQYAGYYHVPELIARGWFEGEVTLRGKTGLIADEEQRSAWCSRRDAPNALRNLLAATGAYHVLISYNSEGVIGDKDLRAILADAAIDGRVKRFTRRYKRYRADSDREGRRYKGDEVQELLYYARLR
jgi:adenine-specific DNA-methyltransferase